METLTGFAPASSSFARSRSSVELQGRDGSIPRDGEQGVRQGAPRGCSFPKEITLTLRLAARGDCGDPDGNRTRVS